MNLMWNTPINKIDKDGSKKFFKLIDYFAGIIKDFDTSKLEAGTDGLKRDEEEYFYVTSFFNANKDNLNKIKKSLKKLNFSSKEMIEVLDFFKDDFEEEVIGFCEKLQELKRFAEKVSIKLQPGGCFGEKEVKVGLDDYNVIVGENNTGKTTFMNSLHDFLEKNKNENENIIFIKDNMLQADKQASVSKQDSDFSILIKKILVDILEKNKIFEDLKEGFKNSDHKTKIEKEINKIFLLFSDGQSVKKDTLKLSFSVENLNEDVLRKFISLKFKDWCGTEDVDLTNVGQGIQKIIIFILLQYYNNLSRDGANKDKKYYILFEEPETFLHPKLKVKLFETLIEFSNSDNVKIIVSTHDTVFIPDTKTANIFKLTRTSGFSEINTHVSSHDEKMTSAEINYEVFGLVSYDYILFLYHQINEKNRKEIFTLNDNKECTLTAFRDQMAHPNIELSNKVHKTKDGILTIIPEDIKDIQNQISFVEKCKELIEKQKK